MILRSPTEDENGGISLHSQPQFSKEDLARQSCNQRRFGTGELTATGAKNAKKEIGMSRAKTQSVVISTEGRNLSQIPRSARDDGPGPSLGVPFDFAQDMLGVLAR